MIEIKIKPLSVNEAWKGRRFKTPKYTQFEHDVLYLLPQFKIPEGKLKIEFAFGLSNSGNDIDNSVKPFLDILQKKYGFNDSRVYELNIKKETVKKGKEFIKFNIYKYDK